MHLFGVRSLGGDWLRRVSGVVASCRGVLLADGSETLECPAGPSPADFFITDYRTALLLRYRKAVHFDTQCFVPRSILEHFFQSLVVST